MERYPIRTPNRPRPGFPRKYRADWILQRTPWLLIAWLALAAQSPGQQLAPSMQPSRTRAPIVSPRARMPRPAQEAASGTSAPPAAPQADPRTSAPIQDQRPGDPAGETLEPAQVPNAPFELTPPQQQALDAILAEWEQRSAKVTLFSCSITRWEYDQVFNRENNGLKRVALGVLKYRAPDRGLYRVWDEKTNQPLEEWRCDGKAIYEFNYDKKQLIKRTLPPELQGKAIANGPLPFIFSAKAETLKSRYFMRLKNPPAGQENKVICIEAYPRFQTDAANFLRAELRLSKSTMMPYALHLVLPNEKSSTDHLFEKIKTNDPVAILLREFSEPLTPLGWTKLVDPEEGAGGTDATAATTVPTPEANPQQARVPSFIRK